MLANVARVLFELASVNLKEDGQNHGTTCQCLTPAAPPILSAGYTISDLVKDFLKVKAKTGRSDRYLRALRVSLRSFATGRGQTPIGNVTVAEIESWLESNAWAPRTQKGYLSDVRVMFNFAVKRNLLAHNPAAAVESPVWDSGPPCIHTPDQVRTVLEFARGYDLDICRCLAIRYFAGLRSSEAERLDEKEIRTADGFIEVTAAKAKTRRRRPATIQENLRAWLQLGGTLPLHDRSNLWRWFRAELEAKHNLQWEHNVTRHSFCSYHLAAFGNAAKTALEAGHTEQMLFAHYRELVTPGAAKEFWAIKPKDVAL